MNGLIIAVLLLLLLAAAWHDVRSRRIPNVLVFGGAVAGLLLNTVLSREMGGVGPLGSLSGLGIGLILLLPLYLLRAMGAGDVKLMAMTGTFLGAGGVLAAFICILLAGGVLALGMAWREHKLISTLYRLKFILFGGACEEHPEFTPVTTRLPGHGKARGLPYGVAIASGTTAYLAIIAIGHWS